jgi:prolyl-tRNA synthetase
MRQSLLFLKTQRQPPKDETFSNAQLLEQAGYIHKLSAGVYSLLPLGLRVINNIARIIRKEMNAMGGQELFMPALHPLENYIQTGRDKIDVLFHLETVAGKKMVLGQSHEEVITPLAQRYISSYRDLPLSLYQIQVKFRNELRAKSGILRGREFMMKDLYSFHRDEEDLDQYYEKMKAAYFRIFDRAGLGDVTHITYASGGSFSKYSHEFQTITDAGEDTIHVCPKCGVAVNQELLHEQSTCPECNHSKLDMKKSIEVGNIFKLKTKFSGAFKLSYVDEQGGARLVQMGCYGIGLGRLMGTIAEIHHDQRGLVWPKSVTPYQVHLLCLSERTATVQMANDIYESLVKCGVDVLYDNRQESAGIKLKDADLLGISIRLVIGEKTGQKVEIKFRDQSGIELVETDELIKTINQHYCEGV